MKAIAVIPARMGSSRFPGKPLVPICGLPMFMHVYYRALQCETLDAVYIATPDPEIRAVAEKYGAPVIMTAHEHERCTDRVAEAVRKIGGDSEIVVNIQGDEPMLYPELVDEGVRRLRGDSKIACVHPICPITDEAVFENRNVIKVVLNKHNDVLYMSREPIPTAVRLGDASPRYQLIVVLAFRRDYLEKYTSLAQTPLEQAESVDIIRILEHGDRISTFEVPHPTISVDEPGDVARVEQALASDGLLQRYIKHTKVPQ